MTELSKEQWDKLKQEHQGFYKAMLQLLVSYDLMNILIDGKPEDEYEPEVRYPGL